MPLLQLAHWDNAGVRVGSVHGMDRLLDLDQVALELERFRRVWSSVGLAVGSLTWRDAADRWPWKLHSDRGEVQDPDSVGVTVEADAAEARIVLFRGGWADVEMGSAGSEPVIDAPSVPDLAAVASLLSGFLPRFSVVARGPEAPLSLYGLSEQWSGTRRSGGHGHAGNPEVWDQWDAIHERSTIDNDAIVVHTQRRAIHGGLPMVGPRTTGPEDLIKSDAVFAAMLACEGQRDRAGLRDKVEALHAECRKIGTDEASWHPAQLTIDGKQVVGVATDWNGWWVVLHVGIDETADVYVYGPPGTKPDPLALEQVSLDAYPEPRTPWRHDPAA
jgi:hypothetical protein